MFKSLFFSLKLWRSLDELGKSIYFAYNVVMGMVYIVAFILLLTFIKEVKI